MNEVERLFQEQQTASDAKRNAETEFPSAQTVLNRDENMSKANNFSPEQQAASTAKRNTEKDIRSVQTMLNIGIILKTVQTALEIGMNRFPGIALNIMRPSVNIPEATEFMRKPLLLLPALLSFCIVLLFYFLLNRQNRQTTEACVPLLILTVILPLITSVISVPMNLFLTHWISRTLQSEAMAAYSVVRSTASMASFLAAPVIPLFAASAGIIRYRFKNSAQ